MSDHSKAIEAACNAYLDGKRNQVVLFVDMCRAVAAFQRACKPNLGPDSTSRLMEGDFQQIASNIADELEQL